MKRIWWISGYTVLVLAMTSKAVFLLLNLQAGRWWGALAWGFGVGVSAGIIWALARWQRTTSR